ncbi:MAG: nucleotidyltransferase domain-containing protein [Actinomycetota bacterium]|nr:nucleotidyltransferase domain-containing protein [Actinomycetota bacterium]MDD5667394.1 nucleotidyltransferase domain-containing protein [Actinomycetota bacterium]
MIDEIELLKAELDVICRRYGVRRLEIFGSAALKQPLSQAGDIDLLVEFESPESAGYANRYFGLLESLETLFGMQVDLVVGSAIKNPYFRESLERTKALLYAH